jgi:hypothetical protein
MSEDIEEFDTIDLAEVDEDEQLDEDGGEGSDATEDGLDDDLTDVYDDPGEVVEGDLS